MTYPFKSEYQANACPPDLNKFYTICYMLLLHFICASDIERNPRKNNTFLNLSLCDWNFGSIAVQNFSNPFLLKAFNVQHKFDMICLSQTYLDTSILTIPAITKKATRASFMNNSELFVQAKLKI